MVSKTPKGITVADLEASAVWMVSERLGSTTLQPLDDVLAQLDHGDPLAGGVLVAQAAHSVLPHHQLHCLQDTLLHR